MANTTLKTGKIAFCGTRGLPANYGGFETAVDEITSRFVRMRYQVDVFCRRSHSKISTTQYEGRNLISVEGSSIRNLETFVSSIQTGWYVLMHKTQYKHIFWFNNANFPGILLTFLAGIPVSVNVDGLEWRRKKWSMPFKVFYYLTSWILSLITPRLISDSLGIQTYYRQKFNRKTHFIPYGVNTPPVVASYRQDEILQSLGLEANKYFLQITRIEPDNLPLEIIRAFAQSELPQQGYTFVLVGYKDDTAYAQEIKKMSSGSGIYILPANYSQELLTTLRNNCYCYVHGNSVGGTNPALLEAMESCRRIMAVDIVFNRETLGAGGHYFLLSNLISVFDESIYFDDDHEVFNQRVHMLYQWDAVALSYAALVENSDPAYLPQ